MTEGTTPTNETPVHTDTAPDKGGAAATGRTFSEAEVQEMIKERLARQSGSERKKLLEELGIEDVTGDAELLKAARAKREADKTELERLAGEAQKAKALAEQAAADLEAERLARRIDRRDTAIQQAALTGKDDKGAALPPAIDAQSVLEWARRDGNKALLDSTLNDDGTVNDKGVKALVDKARKDAGHLFAQPENRRIGTPSHNVGRGTGKEPPKVQTSGRL